MNLLVAESEVKPVIRAVYERLNKISKKGELGEDHYNLYRVLHRYKSGVEWEAPVPETISNEDITKLLNEISEIEHF